MVHLQALRPQNLRDLERKLALGGEFRAKAAYAAAIADAVAATGQDALTLRMIVAPNPKAPTGSGVRLVGTLAGGIILETPRYRALTNLLQDWANAGYDFVEIAGNDDVLIALLSPRAQMQGSISTTARQGFGDYRHLLLVKVGDLARLLRALDHSGAALEHVYDY